MHTENALKKSTSLFQSRFFSSLCINFGSSTVPVLAPDLREGDNAIILVKNFGGKNFAPREREMTNIGFLTYKPKALLNHKNLALLIKKYVCGPIGAADENFLKFGAFSCWRLLASIRQPGPDPQYGD